MRRPALRPSLLVPVLMAVVLPSLHAEEFAWDPGRMEDAVEVVERGFHASIEGHVVMAIRSRWGRLEDGRIVREEEIRHEGNTSLERQTMDARGRLLWRQSYMEAPHGTFNSRARFEGKDAHVRMEADGRVHEMTLEAPEDHRSEYGAFLEALARLRAGEAPQVAFSHYALMEFMPLEMKILDREVVELDGELHEGYVVSMNDQQFVVDEHYVPLRLSIPAGRMEWVPGSPFDVEFDLPELGADTPRPTVEGVLPMEAFLESVELTVTFESASLDDGSPFVQNGYQQLRTDGDAYRLTLLARRPGPGSEAIVRPVAVEGEQLEAALRPSALCQSADPAIEAQAQEIVGEETNALQAVRSITYWVYDHVAALDRRGNQDAVKTLRIRKASCRGMTNLTIALCRAAGIPARPVVGIELLPEHGGTTGAGYHAWTEVWLDDWVPVDATIPEVGTSARYIALYTEEQDPVSVGYALSVILRRPHLRIDAYQYEGGERIVLDHDRQTILEKALTHPAILAAVPVLLLAGLAVVVVRRRRRRAEDAAQTATALERLRRTDRSPPA